MRRFGIRFRAAGFGFGFVLVARVAIVGDVEPRSLEDHGGAAADQTAHFVLPALGAFANRIRSDRLKLLELLATGFAAIFVGRHSPHAGLLTITCAGRSTRSCIL